MTSALRRKGRGRSDSHARGLDKSAGFFYLCLLKTPTRRETPARLRSVFRNPQPIHVADCRHRHRTGVYRRTVRRRRPLGPQGRQRRLLHREPPHAVVHGLVRHDRRRHVGRDFHLGPRVRRRRLLLLHADGRGLHGRAADRRFPADSDLLPAAGRLALRIPRRPLRRRLAPHGRLVLLPVEDAARRLERLRGLRRDAAARLRPLRAAVLGQCRRHDGVRVALHAAGRRQVADLDRHAPDRLPGRQPRAVDPFHHAGPGAFDRRGGACGVGIAHVAHLLLRRSRLGLLLLEDVRRRHRAARRHDGTRSGHDAAPRCAARRRTSC